MKYIIIAFSYFLFAWSLHAQNTKGVSVSYSSPQEQTGKTYALMACPVWLNDPLRTGSVTLLR